MTTFTATVTLRDGVTFEATSGSGHSVLLDSPEVTGGGNSGPCPLELLLEAVGGCAGMVSIALLRRMRQDVTAYRLDLKGTRAETHPKVYTEVAVEHVIEGNNLEPSLVERALTQASSQLCPVVIMVARGVKLTHSYRLIDAASREERAGTLD